jgi:uncharacterized protein YkwD
MAPVPDLAQVVGSVAPTKTVKPKPKSTPKTTAAPKTTTAPQNSNVLPPVTHSTAPAYVPPPAPKTTTAAPKPPAAPPPPSGYASPGIAQTLFSMINSERAANHLPALTWSGQLASSAHGHNLMMAATNTFSHQVAGEASLGARVSATGYSWTWCGENIAWGSVTSSSLAQSLESDMYNEAPPNDGHRQNILSTSAHHVGVDVWTGANGKMWITEDFGS